MLGHWLVPKFPIWILIAFGFGYTPLMSYVSSRLAGLTGYTLGIPYAKQAAFVLSGYKGVDIWFAPVPLADVSAGVTSFRQVELTGTKFGSYLKSQLFLLPLAVAAGLFFWSFLYRISEIPEDYPYAMRFWPRDATLQAFWMTATTTGNEFFMKAIKWKFIAAGACYGLVVYPIMRLLGAPTLFLYGTIQGLVADPAMAMPTFAGAAAGPLLLPQALRPREVDRVHAGAGRRLRRRHGAGGHGLGRRRADRQGHYHGALLTGPIPAS